MRFRRDAAAVFLGGLVLENGERWGKAATGDQREDADAVLDVTSTRRRHWLGRARGYSKTTDVGALVLTILAKQVPPGAELYAAASDADQGGLLIAKIRGFVQRTPGLSDVFDVQARRVVVRSGPSEGASLTVMSADAASAWGLTPHLLVLDELCQWPETENARGVYQALTSAVGKAEGGRLIIMTTAGSPGHWSRKVYDNAVAAPEDWRVSDLHGPPPWMPAREIEIARRENPASVFARLFENRWADNEDRLSTADDIRACVVLDGPQEGRAGVRYVVGLDLGLKNDRTVMTVCHAETRPGSGARVVVVDRQLVWQGTRTRPVNLDEVEAQALAVDAAYGRPTFVYDPWQAAQLSQRLRARGVATEEFTFTSGSIGRLAQWLHLALRDRAIALPNDPELIDELLNVRLRETSPNVYRMDHAAHGHDDRAISLALAGVKLTDGTSSGQGAVYLELWRAEIAGRGITLGTPSTPIARPPGYAPDPLGLPVGGIPV